MNEKSYLCSLTPSSQIRPGTKTYPKVDKYILQIEDTDNVAYFTYTPFMHVTSVDINCGSDDAY